MDPKKLVAIAVVAIVVVAGAAAVLIIKDENSKTNRTYAGGTAGCLQVYGNANNDYYIDNDDVTLIEKIINDKIDWQKDYPFADANCDDKVDSKDVEKVKSIMNATPSEKATANILCFATDRVDGYIEKDVKIPVTAGSFAYTATTLAALMAMGIHDEFVACTTGTTAIEPAFDDIYKNLLDHKIGTRTSEPLAAEAGNYIKDKPVEEQLSIWIFSNANSYDYYKVREPMNKIGVSIVSINDSSANPLEYASCMLTLGFLFGTSSNDYQEKSVKMAEWLHDFDEYFTSLIEKTKADGFVKKKAVVTSSSSGAISGAVSSNTKNLAYIGLEPALTLDNTGGKTSSTIAYNYKSDDWLNKIETQNGMDICIFLCSGITNTWNWYKQGNDMHKDQVPETLIKGFNTYSTLRCYDHCISTSLSYPAPFRNMVIFEYAYPDLMENGKHAADYMNDFYHTFCGWDEKYFDSCSILVTPADLIATA